MKLLRVIVAFIVLAIVPRTALAVTWNPVLTDTFNRPPVLSTFFSGYANPLSTYGINNGWLDLHGSYYQITATNLLRAISSTTGSSPQNGYLMQDPAITPNANQRITVTTSPITVPGANTTYVSYQALLHGQPNGDTYSAQIRMDGQLGIYKIVGGTGTVLGTVPSTITLTTGDVLTLDFQAVGDGLTTTTLTATVTDTTSSATATYSVTDTTGEFQSGGRVGIGLKDVSSAVPAADLGLTQVAIYNDGTLPVTPVTPICEIGDSIMWGKYTTQGAEGDVLVRILNERVPGARFQAINTGQSGSTTTQWLSGSSPAFLTYALNTCADLGVTEFFVIDLGSNDALVPNSTTTYHNNLQSIINSIKASFPAAQIALEGLGWYDYVRYSAANNDNTHTAATLAYISQYDAVLPSLVQSGVYLGDQNAYAVSQENDYVGLYDGIHWNDWLTPMIVSGWADNLLANTNTSVINFVGH